MAKTYHNVKHLMKDESFVANNINPYGSESFVLKSDYDAIAAKLEKAAKVIDDVLNNDDLSKEAFFKLEAVFNTLKRDEQGHG